MEVADVLLLALVVFLAVAGTNYLKHRHDTTRTIRHIPAPALGSEDVPIADRLTHYYRLTQRSVRVLERLRGDYMVSPMLSEDDKKAIDAIVSTFYEEKR